MCVCVAVSFCRKKPGVYSNQNAIFKRQIYTEVFYDAMLVRIPVWPNAASFLLLCNDYVNPRN